MIFDFESNQICYTTCQVLLNHPCFNPIGQVPVDCDPGKAYVLFSVHLIVKEGQCWDSNGPSFGVCVPSHSLSAWYTPSFFPFFFVCATGLDCPFNSFLNSACAWLKWSFSYKKLYYKNPVFQEWDFQN